jgi:hypothetical protein
MSRTRSLATAVALACLASPLTVTSATAAAPAPRPGVVKEHVHYGSKAVEVPKGKRAVISFDGRRGDVVSLSGVAPERLTLFRKGHRVRQTWINGGYYRLPRTARFAFRVRAVKYASQALGLLKARVHRVEVDGKAVTTPRTRRGYVDLAAVRLRAGDRVTVDDGRDDNRLYLPDGRYATGWGQHLLLRPGFGIRVTDDNWPIGREVVAGTTLVRVASGHRVTAASAVEVSARPDGEPVSLSPARRAQREYVFTFDAGTDDLVYLEPTSGPSVTSYTTLLDRWTSKPVDSPISQVDPVSPSFVLPTAGTHEISTVSDALGRATSAQVRLRKGIRVADLTPDGAAVGFTFDGSGTRVYSLATAIGQRLESTATDLGAGEAWMAELSPRDPSSCSPDPYGPLGCGDNGYAFVSDTRPAGSSNGLNMAGPVVVATPGAGTTGTVSIRLLSQIVPGT